MKIFFYAAFKEFLGNFCLGLGIFSLFFFFGESSHLLEIALLVAGSDLAVFMHSLEYLYWDYWLSVCPFVMPMALLLGLALTISRLQEDNELLALESLGINIAKHVFAFAAIIGLMLTSALVPIAHQAAPSARFNLKRFAYEGRNTSKNFKIEPRTWFDLGNFQIFAEEVQGNNLKNVTIYSSRSDEGGGEKPQEYPYKVVGSSAVYHTETLPFDQSVQGKDSVNLRLLINVFNGNLSYPDPEKPGSATICKFAKYENYMPLDPFTAWKAGIRELKTKQLKNQAKTSPESRMEIESRKTIVISPLALAFTCVLVMLKLGRRSKGYGFGLALAMLSFYWTIMVLTASLERPWLANPVFLALGFLLSWLMGRGINFRKYKI